MIHRINTTRYVHVVTIEDPIEFVHEYHRARITQWEIEHVPRYGQYQVGPQSRPGLNSPISSLHALCAKCAQTCH